MPWHRISPDHWENDSDKHLFFDRDTKTVATEYWATTPGIGMVVIPLDVVRKLLEENRYPSFPEAEVLALQRAYGTQTNTNSDLWEYIEGCKLKLKEVRTRNRYLEQLLTEAEIAFTKSLEIVEFDSNKIHSEVANRKAAELEVRKLTADKYEIIDSATAEITRLRAEVKRLKEKCGEE